MRADLRSRTARPQAGSSDGSRCWSYPHQCSRRALDAFPVPVRTLDALHLASCDYLRNQGQSVSLASYDHRMTIAARAMAMPVYDLEPS